MTSDVFGRREVLGLVGVGLAAGVVAGCARSGAPANSAGAAGAGDAAQPVDRSALGGAVSERAFSNSWPRGPPRTASNGSWAK